MQAKEFEEYKKQVARKKSIYALKSRIEDYEFKIVEYQVNTENLKEELVKIRQSLAALES